MHTFHSRNPKWIVILLSLLAAFMPWSLFGQSYSVSQSGTYNLEFNSPATFPIQQDTVVEIPIGFSFTFFDSSYTTCLVGGDGFVTFGSDPGSYCCGQLIPDPAPANNLIAVAWTNMDFTNATYEVLGTAPFRRLIITFDLANPCNETYYGQLKLFETTNIIEIHTQEWNQNQCQGWSATQGLENGDGSEALFVPGRNFNNTWHINNGDADFVSFTPTTPAGPGYIVTQGGPYSIEIDSPTFAVFGEDDSYEIPIGFDFQFFGQTYTNCWVGSDGFVAFGSDPGGGCCGQAVPDANALNNVIAPAWTNMDWHSIHYEVFGTAPQRRLVITFDLRDVCNITYYGQVKLFESSNVIEIHTQEWGDGQTPCNNTTQGIENADGSQAFYWVGRNFNTNWSVSFGDNDVVTFTPNDGFIYLVEEADGDYLYENVNPADVDVEENGYEGIPIGFPFSFYGVPYDSCYINENGFITFTPQTANGCCAGENIPSQDPDFPNGLIAAAWGDIAADSCCNGNNNAYNTYHYEVLGNAPDRRLILSFAYGEVCNNFYYDGQIKLFEGSNIIEIHTESFDGNNAPCAPVTQGIENTTGTSAYYLAGRNANVNWSVPCCNDVVRFTPAMAPPPYDAGITDITNDPFCEGSQLMSAQISNFGAAPLDSVIVAWAFDGVPQSPVTYTGMIPPGGMNYTVNLDTQNLVFGQTYTLKVWTSMPNGQPDGNNTNDTLSTTIHVGLEGIYTIGGSNPDYVTFTAALADLDSLGVCDTVTFHVRPGTYTEQVTVPHIVGAVGRQVIFQAENGDSTSVILQFNATNPDSNYVLQFDNAHNILWQKMTLNAMGSNYARVIDMRNHSTHNGIRHCAINGKNVSSVSNNFYCIYSRAVNPDNLFLGNTIRYGSSGFRHQVEIIGAGLGNGESGDSRSSGPDTTYGLRFIQNHFLDFYDRGIYTFETGGLQIHNNTFESAKNNARAIDVDFDYDTMAISHNRIALFAGSYGMEITNADAPPGKKMRIYDNFILVPGTNVLAGLSVNNCDRMAIYENTIRVSTTTAGRFAFWHGSGISDTVYGNLFVNMGGGTAIFTNSVAQNDFDYNNLFTTGPLLGQFGNTIPDLAQWTVATGFDEHSFSVNPLFASSTDLHVINSFLNGTGSAAFSDNTDIDGQSRSATMPDIGADEFEPVANDVALIRFLSPVLSCTPEQPIEIVLANLGADTINQVTLQWTVNGIAQPDVLYTQSLLPEGDTAHLIISNYTFSNQADSIRVWCSMPNDTADLQTGNDTIAMRFRLPLAGLYTIGGTTPDFPTISAAVRDLNRFHTCGPVTFRIRDGVYTEQVEVDSIPTVSATNTITFESESLDSSAVTIQFSAVSGEHPAVFMLKGTDYVTLHHLGFKSLSSTWADNVELRYNARHITISHCAFEAYEFGSSGICIKSLCFNNPVNEYLNIHHNYFLKGQQAIYLYNCGSLQHAIYIDNNTFVNQRYTCMDLSQISGLYIRNNTISANTTSTSYKGIDLSGVSGDLAISGNSITSANTGDGMFLNSVNYGTSTGTSAVYNNMISTAGTGGGIRLWNCEGTLVAYNSCNMTGSGPAFEAAGGDSLQVLNNILVSNTGKAIGSFSWTPHMVCDFNDLLSISGDLGFWHDTLYPTFTEWQAGTGFDSNSMSITPQFISASDLHVLADTLDGAGTPIAGISTDIDLNPRNANTPDIGADEIGANDDDAGVFAILPDMPFARGAQPVRAVVRNYGGNTLSTYTIQWKLNNVAQPPVVFNGALPSLQQDTIILDTVTFLLSSPYTFKAWTSLPNGNPDFYNSNDTLETAARYAAVSDTLTIGGSMPDLATIADAVTAMSLGGVLDSVHFQIRTGTYHYSLALPQTLGMNCSTPVIFESESGNPADVLWDNLSINNHTLVLNGADGVHFRHLTIKSVLQAYHAVQFNTGSNCNSFLGCILECLPVTTTSTNQAVVFSNGTQTNDIHFTGNTIKNGSYGIYWDGNANTTGAWIQGNIIQNAYASALSLSRLVAPVVHGNTLSSTSAYTYFNGINCYQCNLNTKITANQVVLPGRRGIGITLNSAAASMAQPCLIANNLVVLGSGTYSYGIQVHYSSWVNVYHNTVRLTGGDVTGIAFLRTYVTHLQLKNNIFDNRAGGTAMSFSGNEGPLVSDYNDLFSTGPTLVNYSNSAYSDLPAWQATNFDTSSISQDPLYSSPTGYVITSALLNAVATPMTGVTTDIEGDVRDTLTPDIGCDEFYLASDDVGVVAINYPKAPFPSGENTVFIKFINNGQDTLVSMQVDWEVDGNPQPPYVWTGLLPSAGTYDSLDIGMVDFAPYQYHTIRVWVSEPNGVADGLASNDTIQVDSLYPGLSGVYTIGGGNPDFDSLQIAARHLNRGGAAGPVTFNIRSGTYLETLHLTDYPGAECNRPVIFQSETGDSTDVTLSNLGIDANLITLDGTDGITFRYMTLQSVHPVYQNVLTYTNEAHCNQFVHNRFIGYNTVSYEPQKSVIYSPYGLDTANVFSGNLILYGSYSFYLQGGGNGNAVTRIDHNDLSGQTVCGIYLEQENRARLQQNQIHQQSTYLYSRGMELISCHGSVDIVSNQINVSSGEYGIHLYDCQGTSTQKGLVANNFISFGGSAYTINNGIYCENANYQRFYHNNIDIFTPLTPANSRIGLRISNTGHADVKNNIVVNESTGVAIAVNGSSVFESDYNDYYAPNGSVGSWNGNEAPDLDDWQSSSGQDAHGLEVNPQYMSHADLHVSNILLDGAGIPIPVVIKDIDGQVRGNPPDLGADEFVPGIANDAGIFMLIGPHAPFASGSQPVHLAIKNYGFDTLTQAQVRWVINGIEQPQYAWTGSLLPAQCDTFLVGNYSFAPHADHDLITWTEMPNGVADSTHVNDTLYREDLYPALQGTYTVGGILPDFNLFVQVETALNKGGILGDVVFSIRNGVYSTQLTIGNFPRLQYAHKVTFTSTSGDSSLVTIRKDFYDPGTNYTVLLSNAHRIYFDRITLASTQGRVMDITNGSSQVELSHCALEGAAITYTTFQHQLIFSSTTSEDSIAIRHSAFHLGDYGLYIGGSGGDPEKKIVVEANTFTNCRYRSVEIHDATGLSVRGNTVFNDISDHEGIVLTACSNTIEISQNDIRQYHGGSFGLYLHYVSGTSASPCRIDNNYIYIKGWPNNSHGIYHSFGNYNNFNYNTVRMENNTPGNSCFTDVNSNQNIHIRNCNFANYGGGLAMDVAWLSGYTGNTTNYCNFYSPAGPFLVRYYDFYTTLAAMQAGTNQNLQGKNAEPLFADDSPLVFQAALDGAAIPIAGITTDIYGSPRNAVTPDIGAREFTLPAHDVGAKLLVAPTTYCGLSAAETVTIRIQNYGANTETGFDVAYSMNGAPWTVQNIGGLSVAPGGTADYTFTTTENLSNVGTYVFKLRTDLATDLNHGNDTLQNIEVVHIPALTQYATNLIPVNGAMGVDKPVPLSWNPAPNATVYDVFIWKTSDPVPSNPQIENLEVINTSYNSVDYGENYSWKVRARNICGQTTNTPVQTFMVRELPDLVADSISAPSMAVSEQQIQVEWQVKNNGTGQTQSVLWSDAVYLSLDATLNISFDTYLGGVQNLTALEPGESYMQTATFTIPQGFSGDYYVFVYADRYNNLTESNNNNNWERTATPIHITLLPPPDLVIDQVITPVSAFSGQSIQVQYTGRNNGTGAIPATTWRDRIKLSQDGSSSGGGIVLATLTINGPLPVDSTYDRTITVSLPNSIFGDYFIYVETDYLNDIYEFAAENNNATGSDTFTVFLTPPPNLVNTAMTLPDTFSSNAYFNFSWSVSNQGGTSPTEPYWYDYLYLSLSPVYNPNFLHFLVNQFKVPPVNPANTYTNTKPGRIPVLPQGSYYVYAYTDRFNWVYEYTYENDNITRFGPYTLVNPDIAPVNIVYPAEANAGQNITLTWDLVNHGPGKVAGRYLKYRYYLSGQPVFNAMTAQEVKTTYTGEINLDAEDTLHLLTTLSLPPGLSGNHYVHIQVEATAQMFEQNDAYANNTGSGVAAINIEPGPYPDLHTLSISIPDTATAGQFDSISYVQINSGGADAPLRGKESVYISFDSIWHPEFAQLLSEVNFTQPLAEDSSVLVNRSIFIPVNLTSNVYYLYLLSDQANAVFEYTGETNNVKRSMPFFLKPYPPVDVAVASVSLPEDTLSSGASYSLHYVLESLEAPPTRALWDDAVYLSVDSVFNPELDLQVSVFPVQTSPLQSQDTLTIARLITVPNGIQGDYYWLVEADQQDLNMDEDRENNINTTRNPAQQATSVHINLSPYPDLMVSMLTAPSSAVAGQPLTVVYTITNMGTGNATSWQDRLYISPDNIISNGDIQLYSGRLAGGLLAGNSVTDTLVLDLPAYLSGNYYLLLRTDFLDELYEYTGESNNVTSRVMLVTTPPPSDLIIQVIDLPDSLLAGESATVRWTTKNTGSFPAYGQVREIVYLSQDTVWGVEDQVFGVNQSPFYLPPLAEHQDSVLAPVIGVVNEGYYALVRTDAIQNVPETNEDNNIGASLDPAYIDVKTLYLDSLTVDTLHNGRELYYKLIIDPANASQSILISLEGDSANAYNELFVSFNDAPTRANYQWSNNKPLTGRQRLVIHNTQIGAYYILAYGASTADTLQPVTLQARIMSFEILSVTPSKGSNLGKVTMVIEGSKLDSTYAVRLRDTSGFVLLADTFVIVSPEKVIATFDLRGTPVGFYHVECQIEPYFIASLENGFEVIEGMGPDLEVNWFLAPGSSTPRDKPVKIVLVMINNGDADVADKHIRISSPYGNVMAWTYDDLISGNTFPYLDVPVQLTSGIAGVLPPGNSATYEVFSWLHPFPFYILDVR